MEELKELTVLQEIGRDLEAIGEPEIRRVQRTLQKIRPNEKPLGTIHNEALKKLWTLAARYDVAGQQAALNSLHHADTEEQAAEQRHRSSRFNALEEAVRDLFWIQVKDEIGSAAWECHGTIGVRGDWMLVGGADGAARVLSALISGITRPPEE